MATVTVYKNLFPIRSPFDKIKVIAIEAHRTPIGIKVIVAL